MTDSSLDSLRDHVFGGLEFEASQYDDVKVHINDYGTGIGEAYVLLDNPEYDSQEVRERYSELIDSTPHEYLDDEDIQEYMNEAVNEIPLAAMKVEGGFTDEELVGAYEQVEKRMEGAITLQEHLQEETENFEF